MPNTDDIPNSGFYIDILKTMGSIQKANEMLVAMVREGNHKLEEQDKKLSDQSVELAKLASMKEIILRHDGELKDLDKRIDECDKRINKHDERWAQAFAVAAAISVIVTFLMEPIKALFLKH